MKALRKILFYIMMLCVILLGMLVFPHTQSEQFAFTMQWITSIDDLDETLERRSDSLRAFQYQDQFGYIDSKTGEGFIRPAQNLIAQTDKLFVQKEATEDVYLLFDHTASFVQTLPVHGDIVLHEDRAVLIADDQRSVYLARNGAIDKTSFNGAIIASVFNAEALVAYLFSLGLVNLDSEEMLLRTDTTVVDFVNSGDLIALLRVHEADFAATVFEIYARNKKGALQVWLSEPLESSSVYIGTNDSHSLVAFENTVRIYAKDTLVREYKQDGPVTQVFASSEIFAIVAALPNNMAQVAMYAADARFIGQLQLDANSKLLSVFNRNILLGIHDTVLMITL